MHFSFRSAYAIYQREMARAFRTAFQSILSPVLTTSLYFVVFGSVIGARMEPVGGVPYGAFIIPGLLLSAPVGVAETLAGFVGAAATKGLILAAIILATARLFVDYEIAHPLLAAVYIMLVAASFALFGFILGIWADSFEKLGIIPMLILTPLTFLGGTFYSIRDLPGPWDAIALANPIAFLVSGLRFSFYGVADVPIAVSLGLTLGFLGVCTIIIAVIFRTGWRLRE